MLDLRRKGKIDLNTFKEIADNISRMWTGFQGRKSKCLISNDRAVIVKDEILMQIFKQISEGRATFDLQDYVKVMTTDPEILAWFTKPQDKIFAKFSKKEERKKKDHKFISHVLNLVCNLQTFYQEKMGRIFKILDGEDDELQSP